jgi:group I intron endonuclease
MMTTGIYRISNLVNGHHYVGSGISIEGRWKTHRHRLRKGNHHSIALQRAWDKHGADAFEFVVIETVEDRSKLIEREQIWINNLRSYGNGYNASPTAGSQLGRKLTTEQCERFKLRRTRGPVTESERAAMSIARKGKPRSAEVCRRISEATKMAMRRPEVLKKLQVPCSPEKRAAISAAKRRYPTSIQLDTK